MHKIILLFENFGKKRFEMFNFVVLIMVCKIMKDALALKRQFQSKVCELLTSLNYFTSMYVTVDDVNFVTIHEVKNSALTSLNI